MIKGFKQYIKEQLDSPLDTPVIKIAKKQGIPLDQITKLNCYNNRLTNLEGIENLVNLEKLDCHDNQLTSLTEIENLVNLKFLYCDNNKLTSLTEIENLVNLKFLYCDNNKLTSLEGIEKLTNLKTLTCSGNQLTSLKGIKNLVNLKELYCHDNQLTSLEGIENLVNLEELYCQRNKLARLEGIEKLYNLNLNRLYCDKNLFSDDYEKYFRFEIKLDRSIKSNNFSEFSKIYNSGKKEWQKEYYEKRPDNQDIMDGMNTGMFYLKTEKIHMKSFKQYIKESVEDQFSIGEQVQVFGTVDDTTFNGDIDTIIDIQHDRVETNLDENGLCDDYKYEGVCYLLRGHDWWVSPYNISKVKIVRRYSENDPFGEENWDDTNEASNYDNMVLLNLNGEPFNDESIMNIMRVDDHEGIIEKINKTKGKKVVFYNHKNGKNIKKERISEGGYMLNGNIFLKGTKKDYLINVLKPFGYYGNVKKRIISPMDPWGEENWDD